MDKLNILIAIVTFLIGGGSAGGASWLSGLATKVKQAKAKAEDAQTTQAGLLTTIERMHQRHDQLVAELQQRNVLPVPPQIMPPTPFDPDKIKAMVEEALASRLQRLAPPADHDPAAPG